jgi:uncharacterized protein YprB with RNaseH-like and TPR domain
MLSEEVRRRLEELNRGPLRVRGPTAPAPAPASPVLSLAEALGGREVLTERGPYHLVERPLEALVSDADDFHAKYRHAMERGAVNLAVIQASPELAQCVERNPADLLYLDVETCGFSGTPLFLAGLMTYDNGRLTVHQLIARTYAEEAAVVEAVGQLVRTHRALVTFNGKAFDWPHLRERATAHRVPLDAPSEHVDLLHLARRLWKRHLPNCRLQTLETFVCRRYRHTDLPGALIPETYHEFVRSGDARRMRLIAEHNAMDVLTMADILTSALSGRTPFDD